MNCPACGKDYKDVPENKVAGHYYRGDNHFGKDYRRFGILCNNCGEVSEFITIATGLPYPKRQLHIPGQTDLFKPQEESPVSEIMAVIKKLRFVIKYILRGFIPKSVKEKLNNLVDEIKIESKGNAA